MNSTMKNSGVEWVGEIPQHWSSGYLNQFFIQIKNKNTNLQETNLLSLSYGKIIKKDINSKDGLLPEKFDGYNIIESGDIVLRLTDLQNDHKSLRVGWSSQRGIITSAYITLRKKSNDIDDKFAYYYLHSFDLSKGFYGMGSGVRQGLTYDGLKKLEFLFPKFNEQQQITNFLDEKLTQIDSIVENTKLSIDELNKYKQAIITETITKGLNPNAKMKKSNIDWVGEIPAHWEIIKTKYITEISRGLFSHRPRNDERLYGGQFPFIQTGDVAKSGKFITSYTQTLNENGIKVSKKFPKGTLVMTIAANIGDVAILGFEAYFPDSVVGFIPKENYNSNYLYYLFTSMKNEFLRTAIVSTQMNLNIERIKEMKVPFTQHINEQIEISNYLDEKCKNIDNLIRQKLQLMMEMEEYKKAIIYEYVTGKKEVM